MTDHVVLLGGGTGGAVLANDLAGTASTLAESADGLASVASLLTAALDDDMVRSLAATGSSLGEVAQTAPDEDTHDGLETVLQSVGDAEREPDERVGPLGLVKASRDPDVQYGFGYVLAIARAIGQNRQPADDA
jgi:uncharacterized protein YjgD (DUF1641 family)